MAIINETPSLISNVQTTLNSFGVVINNLFDKFQITNSNINSNSVFCLKQILVQKIEELIKARKFGGLSENDDFPSVIEMEELLDKAKIVAQEAIFIEIEESARLLIEDIEKHDFLNQFYSCEIEFRNRLRKQIIQLLNFSEIGQAYLNKSVVDSNEINSSTTTGLFPIFSLQAIDYEIKKLDLIGENDIADIIAGIWEGIGEVLQLYFKNKKILASIDKIAFVYFSMGRFYNSFYKLNGVLLDMSFPEVFSEITNKRDFITNVERFFNSDLEKLELKLEFKPNVFANILKGLNGIFQIGFFGYQMWKNPSTRNKIELITKIGDLMVIVVEFGEMYKNIPKEIPCFKWSTGIGKFIAIAEIGNFYFSFKEATEQLTELDNKKGWMGASFAIAGLGQAAFVHIGASGLGVGFFIAFALLGLGSYLMDSQVEINIKNWLKYNYYGNEMIEIQSSNYPIEVNHPMQVIFQWNILEERALLVNQITSFNSILNNIQLTIVKEDFDEVDKTFQKITLKIDNPPFYSNLNYLIRLKFYGEIINSTNTYDSMDDAFLEKNSDGTIKFRTVPELSKRIPYITTFSPQNSQDDFVKATWTKPWWHLEQSYNIFSEELGNSLNEGKITSYELSIKLLTFKLNNGRYKYIEIQILPYPHQNAQDKLKEVDYISIMKYSPSLIYKRKLL